MRTYEYTCYYGRDRDDWSKGTIQAATTEEAIDKAERKLLLTGWNLKKSSVKVVVNQ